MLVKYTVRQSDGAEPFFDKYDYQTQKGRQSMIFGNNSKHRNKKSDSIKKKNSELLDDDFFSVDEGLSRIEISGLGIKETKGALSSGDKKAVPALNGQDAQAGERSILKPKQESEGASAGEGNQFFVLKNNKRAKGRADQGQETPAAQEKKRKIYTDYGIDRAGAEKTSDARQDGVFANPKQQSAEPRRSADGNSADAVFSSDFDPFKLAMSEELANKPSSKSKVGAAPKVSERLTEITEEDVERARRIAAEERERKKKQEDFARRKAEYFASIKKHEPAEKTEDNPKADAPSPASGDNGPQITHITLGGDDAEQVNRENISANTSGDFGAMQNGGNTPSVSHRNFVPGSAEPANSQRRNPYSFNPYLNMGGGTQPEENTGRIKSTDGSSYRRAAEFAKAALMGSNPTNESGDDDVTRATSEPYRPVTDSIEITAAAADSSYCREPVCGTSQSYDNSLQTDESGSKFDTGYSLGATPEYKPEFDFGHNEASLGEKKQANTDYGYSLDEPKEYAVENVSENYPYPEDTASEKAEGTPEASEVTESSENYLEYSFGNENALGSETEKSKDTQNAVFKDFPPIDPSAEPEVGLVFEINESIPTPPQRVQPMTIITERTLFGSDSENDSDAEPEEDGFAEDGEQDEEDAEITDVSACPDGDDGEWNTAEIPPEKQNPDVMKMRSAFRILDDEESDSKSEGEGGTDGFAEENQSGEKAEELQSSDADTEDTFGSSIDSDAENPPFEIPESSPAPAPTKEDKHKDEKKKADYSNYQSPPLELLGLEEAIDDDTITAEIQENTKTIIETLASFHVTASIKGVDRGPRITRYEVVPAKGVKVNQITSLFDDIKLYLAAEGVRMEAPIPGKSAIGFEIPNKHKANVRLRELLECDEFVGSKSNTFVCIGKDVAGNPVFGDIGKFPHALIAGATGMGKSVAINAIMISILYKARPDQVKFIMIDPKKVEFKMYSGIPHLLVPVITEAKQAAGALMWAVEEMERRFEVIEKLNLRNVDAYNEKQQRDPSIGEFLPKIVVVIDELNDLMMQVRDPVEDLIMRIAQKARAAGIHLIIGTQRPDVKVITGTIKANINTRISCKVTSVVDSRTILEMAGAEKLLPHGDMLFKPVDKTVPVRVQGAFVSDSEVESVMAFLKNQVSDAQYDEEIFTEINKAAQKCGNKKGGAQNLDDDGGDDGSACGYYGDQQFLDAVELAIRLRKVATSLLQRKMSIGYSKAAKFIDCMEEIGVVGPPNGSKPREVLITLDEWYEKLSRMSDD